MTLNIISLIAPGGSQGINVKNPTEEPLIRAGCMEQPPLSSKGKEGKLEVTLGKWHTRSYLLQEQCKFTVKGADESQRVYTAGCFYSNQVAQTSFNCPGQNLTIDTPRVY